MSYADKATTRATVDATTIYGWNDEETAHLVIVGPLTPAVKNAVANVFDDLDEDRRGQQWSRAMLRTMGRKA